MNRRIRIALTAGFTVLAERAMRRYIEDRQQQRAARIIWVQRNRAITFPLFSFFRLQHPGDVLCGRGARGQDAEDDLADLGAADEISFQLDRR
ncbi:MAG: hypothetical protein GC196_11785 [Hyphomonas sp.]|nr:hypothetical protein [Hyphomonas sp.]